MSKLGKAELAKARRAASGLLSSVFVFSVFVNLLMLTGPLFMLQVYDRVLGSRSEETLVALFVLVAVLFALMGILDTKRAPERQRGFRTHLLRTTERACICIAEEV